MDRFDQYIGDYASSSDLNERLCYGAVRTVLADTQLDDSTAAINSFVEAAPNGSMLEEEPFSAEKTFVIDDLYDICDEWLLDESNWEPRHTGKLLIIAEANGYMTHGDTSAVLLDMMNMLPGRYYPASVADAEYILLIEYGYEYHGLYSLGAQALQETGKIGLYQAPDFMYGEPIYESETVYGKEPPESFSSTGLTKWKSGDAPNMGKAIFEAVSKIA